MMAILGTLGCGGDSSRCAVSGSVAVNGKPTGGVYLQFQPTADDKRKGRTDGCKSEPDGSYKLAVHGPGEYAVTTFRPRVTVVQGEEIEGDDLFEQRFRDVGRPVAKVVIGAGGAALDPINIKFP